MGFRSVALEAMLLFAGTVLAAPLPLTNPPEIASENGVLSGTLTVAPGDVVVRGKHVQTTLYNGQYMPPILRVQPGDAIRLRLANASSESTNIHYHGFTVTPRQNAT